MGIGTKIGTTYYSDFKTIRSITNPIMENEVNMKHHGFFTPNWTNSSISFDNFGYGLKKTISNQGVIFCESADKLFSLQKGYVSILIDLPYGFKNGVYQSFKDLSLLNRYVLWGTNVGTTGVYQPGIGVVFAEDGLRFEINSSLGYYCLLDHYTTIDRGTVLFEFIWDNNGLNDFGLEDFKTTMCIRINGEETVIGNAPLGSDSLFGINFYALGTAIGSGEMECTIKNLIIANEVPVKIQDEYYSSSTSSESESSISSYTSGGNSSDSSSSISSESSSSSSESSGGSSESSSSSSLIYSSSSSQSYAEYLVSGFGEADVNGTYSFIGYNPESEPVYRNSNLLYYMAKPPGGLDVWNIVDYAYSIVRYYTLSALPETGTWEVSFSSAPAPAGTVVLI